jgi:dolichyl-phosphate beta-glucosyltransferase
MVEEKLVILGKSKREAEISVDDAEVFMSVVVPAYNEEERISNMLEEALAYLQPAYGTHKNKEQLPINPHAATAPPPLPGWEILIVSDGSTDKTTDTALAFAHKHRLPEGALRVIALEENRGKGGAVTHGMRHVRGQYAVFADADGASKFEDLAGLVEVCQKIEDPSGRAVAIGSRAHLVGSDAVVKVRKQSADKGTEVSTLAALHSPQCVFHSPL